MGVKKRVVTNNGVEESERVKPRPTRRLYVIVIILSFCQFMMGYDFGYVMTLTSRAGEDLLSGSFSYGNRELVVSSLSFGAFLGALFSGALADTFGRKPVIVGANTLLIGGACIQCGAQWMWSVVGGRFVVGCGVGLGSSIAPLLITELSPPEYRGRMITFVSLVRTFFQVFSVALFFGLETKHYGAKIHIGLSLVFTVAQSLAFVLVPESPRYLAVKGYTGEAQYVLSITHNDISQDAMHTLLIDMGEGNEPGGFPRILGCVKRLFWGPNFKRLLLISLLQAINQFTGFNPIMYYLHPVFDLMGYSEVPAFINCVVIMSFIFTIPTYFLIDRMGRRLLLFISIIGVCAMQVLNTIGSKMQPVVFRNPNNNATYYETGYGGVLMMAGLILFVIFYAFGIGTIPWTQPEHFPTPIRSLGNSFACSIHWAASLIMTATFFCMMDNITSFGTFLFYSIVAFIGFWLILLFYPELANHQLEHTPTRLNVKQNIKLSNLTHKPLHNV